MSTVLAVFMRRLRSGWGRYEALVAGERGKLHHDLRQAGGIGRELGAQPSEVGQLADVQVGGELTGEFGLAAALVRQRQQIDHEPAGFPVRQPFAQAIEGSAIGIAREQPIPVDEIE